MRPGLRRIDRLATPTPPLHMPTVAGAPHGTGRPAWGAVVMAVRAACRWYNDPAVIGGHQIAHEVVGELVTPWLGDGDFVT